MSRSFGGRSVTCLSPIADLPGGDLLEARRACAGSWTSRSPDGPTRTMNSPSSISSETSSTAMTSLPNTFVIPSRTIFAIGRSLLPSARESWAVEPRRWVKAARAPGPGRRRSALRSGRAPISAAPDDRGRVQHVGAAPPGATARSPRLDPREEGRVVVAEDPAPEHDVDVEPRDAAAGGSPPRPCATTSSACRSTIAARDRVAVDRRGGRRPAADRPARSSSIRPK